MVKQGAINAGHDHNRLPRHTVGKLRELIKGYTICSMDLFCLIFSFHFNKTKQVLFYGPYRRDTSA